jgi:hypothetical protein
MLIEDQSGFAPVNLHSKRQWQAIEFLHNSMSSERGVRHQRQAFPREVIDQDPEGVGRQPYIINFLSGSLCKDPELLLRFVLSLITLRSPFRKA